MPHRIRLIHKLLEGGFHVYTSPDVNGLHVTAETQADAQREAITVVHAIADELGVERPVVSFSEMAQAA